MLQSQRKSQNSVLPPQLNTNQANRVGLATHLLVWGFVYLVLSNTVYSTGWSNILNLPLPTT